MNYFDIIIVVIIAIFTLLGYKKGLVVGALRFITWVLSFVLARIISPIVAEIIIKSQYFNSINTFVNERLVSLEQSGIQNFSQSLASANQGQSSGIVGDILIQGLKGGKLVDTTNILSFLSMSLSIMMIRIGSMVLVFIALSIIFAVLIKIAKGFVQLPVIKQLDKAGGLCLGILEGVIIAYIVILLISVFKIGGIEGEFQNTLLAKYLLNMDFLKKAYLMVSL